MRRMMSNKQIPPKSLTREEQMERWDKMRVDLMARLDRQKAGLNRILQINEIMRNALEVIRDSDGIDEGAIAARALEAAEKIAANTQNQQE